LCVEDVGEGRRPRSGLPVVRSISARLAMCAS
jgi:hypothetical protein